MSEDIDGLIRSDRRTAKCLIMRHAAHTLQMFKAWAWITGWGRPGDKSPRIWSVGLFPQILSCCKILSSRLLALQCRKMCFCLYSRTVIVSPAMRPPRIPVRSTPMVQGQRVTDQGHAVNAHRSPKYQYYIGNRGSQFQRRCHNFDR